MQDKKAGVLDKGRRKRKRRIAVLGISNYGYYLAQKLVALGCEVLAVDKNPQRVRSLQDAVDQAVIGDVTDSEVLKSLQLDQFDSVVLTIGEEMGPSLLALLHLRDLGVREILAKAVSEDHARILDKIGATEVIFPERDMAFRTANVLSGSNVLDYLPLGEEYSILEIAPDDRFLGKRLRELELRARYHVEVLAIKEFVPERTTIPDPDFLIKDSDLLVVVGKNEDLQQFQKR